MSRARLLVLVRRVLWIVMIGCGFYLFLRFDGSLAPGVAGGPIQRVLVDRWAQPGIVGERLLYRDRAGLLAQGWTVRQSGANLILAPAPFIEAPQGGQEVGVDRIRGRVILVLGAAEVPLRSDGLE
jgi:hypothetical protein